MSLTTERTIRPALLLFAAVYAALLAVGLDFGEPYFRPYEEVVRGPRFRPNAQLKRLEHGVFSYRVGAESLKLSHPVTFNTDQAGFRNAPLSQAPPLVVLGDSFVFGVGLSDEETLPAQLSKRLGVTAYNYGAVGVEAGPLYLADGRFRPHPPRVVLWVLGSKDLDKIRIPKAMSREEVRAERDRQAHPSLWASFTQRQQAITDEIERFNKGLTRDNGLAVLSHRWVSELRVQAFGPPDAIYPDGKWALVDTLARQRLFEPLDERAIPETLETLRQYQRALAAQGSRFILCPVPEAGLTYPDLFPEAERVRMVRPTFLDTIRDAATEAGLEVVDLLPLFAAHRSPYLYIRDDNHWTPETVALVADFLEPRLRDALGSP